MSEQSISAWENEGGRIWLTHDVANQSRGYALHRQQLFERLNGANERLMRLVRDVDRGCWWREPEMSDEKLDAVDLQIERLASLIEDIAISTAVTESRFD